MTKVIGLLVVDFFTLKVDFNLNKDNLLAMEVGISLTKDRAGEA